MPFRGVYIRQSTKYVESILPVERQLFWRSRAWDFVKEMVSGGYFRAFSDLGRRATASRKYFKSQFSAQHTSLALFLRCVEEAGMLKICHKKSSRGIDEYISCLSRLVGWKLLHFEFRWRASLLWGGTCPNAALGSMKYCLGASGQSWNLCRVQISRMRWDIWIWMKAGDLRSLSFTTLCLALLFG